MALNINKSLLPGLFILLSTAAVTAQDYVRPQSQQTFGTGNPKFGIGISVGPAIPLEDFGSTNVKGSFWDFHSPDSTHLQGFAQTGFHFELNAFYLIGDNVGIIASIGGNVNSIDLNTFTNVVGFPATASQASYYTGEYLIGPYFSFPVSKTVRICGSVMVGLVQNNYPTLTLQLNDSTTYTRNIANGNFAIGYSIDAGLAYMVAENVEVHFNVTYTGANITYPNWIESETLTVPGYYPVTATVYHTNDQTFMATGILKPLIGIIFRF